jgi:hypothetical protein
LNPTADGADALAAFLANCFSEASLPVGFFAVCLVLAIMKVLLFLTMVLRVCDDEGGCVERCAHWFLLVPAHAVFVAHFMYHVYNDGNPFLKHYMYVPLLLYCILINKHFRFLSSQDLYEFFCGQSYGPKQFSYIHILCVQYAYGTCILFHSFIVSYFVNKHF